jgi:hypothetical protein
MADPKGTSETRAITRPSKAVSLQATETEDPPTLTPTTAPRRIKSPLVGLFRSPKEPPVYQEPDNTPEEDGPQGVRNYSAPQVWCTSLISIVFSQFTQVPSSGVLGSCARACTSAY